LESNVPVSYGCRPPHIHVRVRAPTHEELVTQQYLLQRLGIVERLEEGTSAFSSRRLWPYHSARRRNRFPSPTTLCMCYRLTVILPLIKGCISQW
jgi:hypothetical protein